MNILKTTLITCFRFGWIGLLLPGPALDAQINLIRDTYAQFFNGLISSDSLTLEGTASVGQSVDIPALQGWYAAKLGGSGSVDMTLNADDGTQNGGRVYSYGSAGSVERALGLKGSGTHFAAVGVAFINATNVPISSVTITYQHEIWSVQGTTGSSASEDRLSLAYGVSGNGITVENFLENASMTRFPALDAVSSSALALTGVSDGSNPGRSRDGNSVDWRQEISSTIGGLNWQPGTILFIRWQDEDTSGFDAGHGIDDFQLEAGGSGFGDRSPAADVGVKVDGDFSDWKHFGQVLEDPTGDKRTAEGIDFIAVGGAVSADGLSLYIRTAEPHVLSDSNLSIYLDTDGNPETGLAFNGLGAEILLDFSVFQSDQRFFPADAVVYPEAVRLPAGEVIADFLPNGLNSYSTHPASEEFEILIPVASLRGLTPGGRLGILLRDRVGDFAPDLGSTFFIDVPENILPEPPAESFDKVHPDDVRVASWNVLVNGPLNPEKAPAFGRQLAATKPDIIHFQELYEPSASWARDFVNEWLPLESGQWQAVKNVDCITVSRYEIIDFWRVDGNLVVLLDTRDVWGINSLFVNAHTPAHVENQQPRISETTNFMLLLRRLMNGTEPSAPTEPFATFVVGDLNANSPKIELSTFRTGTFIPSAYEALNYWPDQYGLPLVDAAPRQTHSVLPRLFTWRSLASGNSQRLDYIYYQQSRLTKTKAFVVNTDTMPADFLEANNLQSTDSRESDHLLLITDFKRREVGYAWHAQDIRTPGWFLSKWMGWLYPYPSNFYFSPLHQGIYAETSEGGVWVWDTQLGWWFSHATLYPFAYRYPTADWIYFLPAAEPPRTFFNYATGQWESD